MTVVASVFLPLGLGLVYFYHAQPGARAFAFIPGALLVGLAISLLLWAGMSRVLLKPFSRLVESAFAAINHGQDCSPTAMSEKELADLVRAIGKNRTGRGNFEQMVEQEKLEAMGEVSAGLAHEIRNPLSAILSGISLLESNRRTSQEREHIFKLIKRETQALNASLTDFLLFARPQKPQKVRIDLGALIREIVQLVEDDPELKGEVEIHLQLNQLDHVWFDGDQLRQVIWNVTLNALQAMKGKGELTIKTGKANKGLFRLEIEDTGPGVPEELSHRIFDPFFSTRKHGTGLGLSIVRRIVAAHRGFIELASRPGQGARFVITAPEGKEKPGYHDEPV